MYHAVSSISDSPIFSGVPSVSIKDFESQLIFLLKNGTPLSEKDVMLAALTGNYPDDDYFYLTFDDGFKQHFDNVYPVLKDYNIQASFFVPTMALESSMIPTVEKQRLLQYSLFSHYHFFLDDFCLLAKNKSKRTDKNIFSPSVENIRNSQMYLKEYDFYSNEERFFRLVRNEYLNSDEFSQIINTMFTKFYSNDKKFINEYYMNISDLKEMSSGGMVIGGHTYSHPFLNKIPVNNIREEIDRNISFLESVLKKNINSFAYPYGAFDKNVVDCLKLSNIDYSFDTRLKGINTRHNIKRNDAATFFHKPLNQHDSKKS
jgi:peptidoglycan/xylan/chitin deacetylase (PgdA/CDA1 family)